MGEVDNKKLVIMNCLHQICLECYEDFTRQTSNLKCPICKKFFSNKDILIHPEFRAHQINKSAMIIKEIFQTPPEDKIIVYAQFQFIIDKLHKIFGDVVVNSIIFKKENEQSSSILKEFRTNAEIKVLLVSTEQKINGLNITEANHVFFAHPLLGMDSNKRKYLYHQCIGNVHRIGQKKKVFIKFFATNNHLENKVENDYKNLLI